MKALGIPLRPVVRLAWCAWRHDWRRKPTRAHCWACRDWRAFEVGGKSW